VEKRWVENEKILNENIGLFPKSCVYMRWNYDYPELPGNKKAINWYASHQLHAMAATSGQQIWPMLPRASSNFQSIKDFSKITAAQHLDGILLTLWDDTSPHFETYWRGIHDFALFTWNYSDMPKEKAHAMFRKRFYGPQVGNEKYAFEDVLERGADFWETALINSGDRYNYPKKIDTLDLPDPNSSGGWSSKEAKRLTDARTEIKRYDSVKQMIDRAMSVAKRNQYALQLFGSINELEMYPAQLLLLIEKYDLAKDPQQKEKAKKAIGDYAAGFDNIRKKYESIFKRSRVLHNPSDYLPDQNHHAHLANGTNTSDWMYVYELAMNEKIRQCFNR
jgi:hypothetical protein